MTFLARARSSRTGVVAAVDQGAPRALRLTALMALACASVVGCTSDPAADGKVQLQASFYPLQWMAEQVGGLYVDVASLTKPGAEPHDLELSPRDVGAIEDADVVVYLAGFQPAIDDALRDVGAGHRFDAGRAAGLDLAAAPTVGEAHAEGAGKADPHVWLDPTKLARVADAFATTLARVDPAHERSYRANARRLHGTLLRLDRSYRTTLAECSSRRLVTSHSAFGYLARRYGLEQVSITGLSPEGEPSPGALARVSDLVRTEGVRTVYFETLVGRGIARTVAKESGARTDVLDPIEGLTDRSQGRDYLQVMRANLANLVKGQPCP